MKLIDLDHAVSEIKQTWEDVGEDPRRSPFFLIVGAGISFPPVPLAGTIIEHCEKIAQQYKRAATLNGNDRILDRYSHWFGLAYPHARQRQKYFRSLIENQPISLANLRLAHLLSAARLTNLVVTTNFDDFLIKALRLFGQAPAVCDHPSTVARIDLDRDGIQIVYAHGSYLFYDLANLQGEVSGRAQMDRDSSLTMMGLLDSVLWNRSPIVVGYSGWEGDVIMSALKRRLGGGQPLGQSIYWCCYKRESPDQLPAWLRNSSDVQFVVPPEKPAAAAPVTSRVSGELTSAAGTTAHDQVDVLTAREVFEKLGQGLGAQDPPLLADPLKFFADQLESALPKEESLEAGSDPYGFRKLIERIRTAGKRDTSQSRGKHAAKLDAITAAVRQSEYAEAIRAAVGVVPGALDELTAEQRKDVLSAVGLAGEALLKKVGEPKGGVEAKLVVPLATMLSFDPRLEEQLGTPPGGTAVLFAARAGQLPLEAVVEGHPRGAFSLRLEEALRKATTERKRRNLRDVIVQAAVALIKSRQAQSPVLVGQAHAIPFLGQDRKRAGRLVALLVGINEYQMASANLRGCVNDVKAYAKLLKGRPAAFGKPEIVMLTDKQATKAKIQSELTRLIAKTRPDDALLFYFSGHMINSGEAGAAAGGARTSLIVHDYDGKEAGELTVPEVVNSVGQAKARRKLIILD
jgi:caspase domain-containing protein/SIR2-like protein